MSINPSPTGTSGATPAVSVQQLSFRYRSAEDDVDSPAVSDADEQSLTYAIKDISFTLPTGELLLIAGPSGCGKSTLLKCLNGLIPRSYKGILSGEIQIEGQLVKDQPLRELARLMGTMLQDPDKQILGSTVEQEIAFGLENLNVPRAEILQRVNTVLARLHLERYQKRATHALSGGLRQQVAAAGLLIMQPSIFLFDEPFANLDARAVDELETLITNLREEGHTIIIVEHRVEETLKLNPDKVLLIREGRQAFFGATEDFLAHADPTEVKLPVAATLRSYDNPAQAYDALITPIVTGQQHADTSASDNAPLLTFEHVSYRYAPFAPETLRDVSFKIYRGETIALLGPNGAGKTTLVKQALGLLRPTKGSVSLGDKNIRALSIAQIAARIGYVFQSPGAMLFAPTVQKELNFGPENLRIPPERRKQAIEQAATALNIAQFTERSPFALSFGQQKRVAIASVLAMQSKILLLDEPTAGQDHRSYMNFMEHLRNLSHLDAFLFITHDLDLALRFTQRVLLLKDGALVADGKPLEVLSDASLLEHCNLRPTSLLHFLLQQQSQGINVSSQKE